MRALLFFFLFSSSSLSACSCFFIQDFCTYASGFFERSDTAAVIRHAKFIGFRNPEEGAYLYDFVAVEDLFGGTVADTVTLWGQDGGNCNGPIRQLAEGNEYILLHSATQGIFSYFDHTLENFSNPYPIYDFLGCGPAAIDFSQGTINGPVAPGIESYSLEEFKTNITDCISGKLVSTVDGKLPAIEFSVWPNPSPGALTLNFRQAVFADDINLLDMTGRVVRTMKGEEAQRAHRFSLDAAGLPTGVYVVRIVLTNGRIGSKRVVIR